MEISSLDLGEALRITLEHSKPLAVERIPLAHSTDRIAASDIYALVDAPSVDSSLKDGYAVVSHDIARASPEMPVRMNVTGHVAAGVPQKIVVKPGTAVRVLTGARIPSGADAVLAEEFAQPDGDAILAMNDAANGKNILPRGRDVEIHTRVVRRGQQITPGIAGLLAAAGHSMVPVYRSPTVAIIGTGDEIVAPGEPLDDGKIYASNIMTLNAWCTRYGMTTRLAVVRDDHDVLVRTLKTLSEGSDALMTSGGAWTGDHDLVGQALEGLGWRQSFHRIRMGPGKAVGFGTLDGKPIFILPGGPPSNLMGFLQIALPGLLALAGHAHPGLPRSHARLAADLEGSRRDWTQFFFGRLDDDDAGLPVFRPIQSGSRLRNIAEAEAIAALPEGQECLKKGAVISVQLLK